jgi:hypothetical protein
VCLYHIFELCVLIHGGSMLQNQGKLILSCVAPRTFMKRYIFHSFVCSSWSSTIIPSHSILSTFLIFVRSLPLQISIAGSFYKLYLSCIYGQKIRCHSTRNIISDCFIYCFYRTHPPFSQPLSTRTIHLTITHVGSPVQVRMIINQYDSLK